MADAYRYPLTRICLRTGTLTLPLNLLGVFPDRGDIVAVDPQKDAEYTLQVEGRRVLGLAPYFAVHDLTPNDWMTCLSGWTMHQHPRSQEQRGTTRCYQNVTDCHMRLLRI